MNFTDGDNVGGQNYAKRGNSTGLFIPLLETRDPKDVLGLTDSVFEVRQSFTSNSIQKSPCMKHAFCGER